jgi:membrane protein
MGLVPVLALACAALRGLGWHGDRLEELILSRATILSPEAIRTLVSYIDNTSFAGLGALGGAVLVATTVSVLSSIEGALNAIWGRTERRSFVRRAVDYCGILVVAPILLAVAMSLTAAVQNSALALKLSTEWHIGPMVEQFMRLGAHATVWLLFGVVYTVIPNTKVRLGPAVIGSIAAGTIWQVTQWTYIRFQIGMANYNAIYGALAQLPVLMAWVYVSWVIVLLGAELVCAVQTTADHERDRRLAGMHGNALLEYAALSTATELGRVSLGKREATGAAEIADCLDLPLRLVRSSLAVLAEANLAHVSAHPRENWYLSRAPHAIPLLDVFNALDGALPPVRSDGPTDGKVRQILERVCKDRRASIETVTIGDLVG